MPMNQEERKCIEYRPNLGYKPDILAIIEAIGADESATTHVFPTEIQEALANPAGPVFNEALNLLDDFDNFLDELEAKLADNVAETIPQTTTGSGGQNTQGTSSTGDNTQDTQNAQDGSAQNIGSGISFQDYLTARNNGDSDTADAYEAHHRNSLDGKIEAELYPLLAHIRENLAANIAFLNEQAFLPDNTEDTTPGSAFNRMGRRKPTNLQDDDYKEELVTHYDNPDAMMNKEAKELDALVRHDVASGTSNRELAKLKSKTEIVKAINEGLAAKREFLNDAKILTRQSLNEAFSAGGDPTSPIVGVQNVVENLATASQAAVSSITSMVEVVHAKLAEDMEDLAERQEKLYAQNTIEAVHKQVDKLRKLYLDAEENLSWMESLDTHFDQASVVDVIEQSLQGIHMVLDGYEAAMLDLRKTNNLEKLQNEDIINTLSNKDLTRKSYNVISDMKTNYMPGTSNAAKNFVTNMDYKKSSVTKTKAKARASGSLNRSDRR